jgi:hypothetical protein
MHALNRFFSGYVPVLLVLSTVAPAGPARISIAALLDAGVHYGLLPLPSSTGTCLTTLCPPSSCHKRYSLSMTPYFPWAALFMYICLELRLDFVYYLLAM